ncbi:MAG TPA: hypothetical protein PLM07_02865 [Candidatus Rifleibacterium sp.]|nr:hypothetical protein [Candidatus Rifleibacterium sp.]HPT44826.1 hypothetical protein [Candidatus Rifleibacterium sp.]
MSNPVRKHGFSFVEILFAVIFLGFLIAPIFSLLTQSSSGTVQNRNDILAQQHATNLLAYAYALPYDHAFLTPGPARVIKELNVTADGKAMNLGMDEEMFTRSFEVDEHKPADWPHAYKILTVRVKWKQANESARQIKVAGLVSQ